MSSVSPLSSQVSKQLHSQYKNDLKKLVSLWATARVSKEMADLKLFKQHVESVYLYYKKTSLVALQQVFSTLLSTCEKGISARVTIAKTNADIDWLLNQLIRSNTLNPDPFLQIESYPADSLSEHLHDQSIGKRKTIRVAIIDDELSVGSAIKLMLEQFAFDTELYASVGEFEHSLSSQRPDIVLLDVCMPNISQTEVFGFAKQLVARGIKVISCSSLFTFDTRLLAVRAGVSDYAVKPVNMYELVEKINRALKLGVNNEYEVVMLDDHEAMGEFYESVFSQVNVDFHYFSTAQALIASLEHLQPDLFLLDNIMPSVNGLEVAEMIRQDSKFDFAPIIFLTADEQTDTKLKVLAHKGDDLIAKSTPSPLVLQQVMSRLERSAFIKSFVSKDPLTGVLNHGQIIEAANHQMRINKRQQHNSVLALLDVDLFKKVNDEYGHAAGDKVLNGLGQLLQASVRETDFVGRYGGEEFFILFVDCNLAQAEKKINAIREKCSSMRFVLNAPGLCVTFSGGIVPLEAYTSLPAAVADADKLLYLAKESGRNQIKSV